MGTDARIHQRPWPSVRTSKSNINSTTMAPMYTGPLVKRWSPQ